MSDPLSEAEETALIMSLLLPVNFPTEMLTGDGEDLLQQLSQELGIPEFMEEVPTGPSMDYEMHQDDNGTLFSDLRALHNDGTYCLLLG